jgi:MoaA/NifB/PqqE/SkfB family radical SAM enzyme
MNNVDDIYSKFGENFCICPFLGGFYQSHHVTNSQSPSKPSTIVPCCMIAPKNEFNLVDNNILASINQPVWKTIRQKFIEGKHREIPQCKICHDNEDLGVSSTRIGANLHYIHHCETDIIEEVETIVKNNYTVDKILSLDWYPSNYCNYSCIMCVGGASSSRMSFEIKILKQDQKIVLNAADPDFFAALEKVQLINFTGGETALQKQVHDIMDYLIEKDLAKNILITLLTNASSSANDLDKKFCKFKKVVYNVSIDGIGQVIEYQRRGAKWSKVEANALELMSHPYISTVINYVLTGVNVLSAMDFVNWAYDAEFGPHNPGDVEGSFINVSPVFRVDHLGVAALPVELRELALDRLKQGRQRFESSTEIFDTYYTQLVDRFISVIEKTPHNPAYLSQFIKHIHLEDSVSKTKLIEVVPEWASYFQS